MSKPVAPRDLRVPSDPSDSADDGDEDGSQGSRARFRWLRPFLAGAVAAGAGMILAQAASSRRRLDPRLIRRSRDGEIPPVVLVPGIMGNALLRPDGTQVWLNLRNAIGYYNLSLPLCLPLSSSCDDLSPGALLGTDRRMPRMFGFTEYYDLIDLLRSGGFRPEQNANGGASYEVFTYDWRRDLVESARRLHEALEILAEARHDPEARFNVIGHSMGGLVARYYLRYGTAEPDEGTPVTWAGARRIRNLVLVATPNAGSITALEALLFGSKVGLSYTTLAAPVIARMPSGYHLLPPVGTHPLLDRQLEPLDVNLHDIGTWHRFRWGPFAPDAVRRLSGMSNGDAEAYIPFLEAALARAAAFHRALARVPETPCPARVIMLGGDCLPTLGRAIVPDKEGLPPRFEPGSRTETDAMFEAGDGRVTRASVLAAHLPYAEENELSCGLPEVAQVVFGSADHHGIYSEPTFQSILLRLLLTPRRRARPLAPPSPA